MDNDALERIKIVRMPQTHLVLPDDSIHFRHGVWPRTFQGSKTGGSTSSPDFQKFHHVRRFLHSEISQVASHHQVCIRCVTHFTTYVLAAVSDEYLQYQSLYQMQDPSVMSLLLDVICVSSAAVCLKMISVIYMIYLMNT